jgi:hypothetical protein
MIPTIEEILVKLANGDMSIDDADHWIREHLSLAENTGHLRDLFAGLAMQQVMREYVKDLRDISRLDFDLANVAYKMADAMMEARTQ